MTKSVVIQASKFDPFDFKGIPVLMTARDRIEMALVTFSEPNALSRLALNFIENIGLSEAFADFLEDIDDFEDHIQNKAFGQLGDLLTLAEIEIHCKGIDDHSVNGLVELACDFLFKQQKNHEFLRHVRKTVK